MLLFFSGCHSSDDDSSSGSSVSQKTIAIDGEFDDWSSSDRVYIDTDGAECNNVAGRDIRELYLAQDDTYIYFRVILNNALDSEYGIRFGGSETDSRHVFTGIINGQKQVFIVDGNTLSEQATCPELPSNFVSFSDNQLEAKVFKYDLATLDDHLLALWSGAEIGSGCIDYVSIGKRDFSFSGATVPENCSGEEFCGYSGLPLTISDVDFPSDATSGSIQTGSVAYQGTFSEIESPMMLTRVYAGSSTLTTSTSPAPTASDCRISFSSLIPSGISGSGVTFFKMIDQNLDGDDWDDKGVSNEASTDLNIQ